MPKVLKLTQLIYEYRMTQMQIRRGWIKSGFDLQRFATIQLCPLIHLKEESHLRRAISDLSRLEDYAHPTLP